MSFKAVPIWKEAPFLRLILPFIFGIIAQWYLDFTIVPVLSFLILLALLLLLFQRLKFFTSFIFYWINGCIINLLLFFTGACITYYQDFSHHSAWVGNHYHDGVSVVVKLEEPPSEKDNSFKALASLQSVVYNDSAVATTGMIFIYFQKDSSIKLPGYGSQLIFKKPLVRIKNSGNPAAFDFERYCAFQGIYHQVFLKNGDYNMLKRKENPLWLFLFKIRSKTVSTLQKFLHSPKESGLAEALLIGYKDDLDKSLVQSYANTGVVHIIAISGMQLALIYGFLVFLFKPFNKFQLIKWFKPLVLLFALWLFSLLSGASPSVLRAAVMFTCIVIGEVISQKTSIYNNLAASAFLLLCYNPFWLWDTGFQLSYAAVFSIVIFMKPVYHLFYIKNKALDFIWELISVSLAAQILTTPISIYYFHQFPTYFLLTNLVAVPVSTIVLFGELVLLALSVFPYIATPAGMVLAKLVYLMDSFIEQVGQLPFSRWENLQISVLQVVLLYAAIAGFSVWLLAKKKKAVAPALSSLVLFCLIRCLSFRQASLQQKIIVYNIPRHQGIDFISGRNYLFKGDTVLQGESFLQNFHLRPSRISHRVSQAYRIPGLIHGNALFLFNNKRILVIDQSISPVPPPDKIAVDVIVLSKNPNLSIAALAKVFDCNKWVFDASNSEWKISKWKAECEQLHLSCFPVVDKGAFVMNMD